jgi:hypothetical protein
LSLAIAIENGKMKKAFLAIFLIVSVGRSRNGSFQERLPSIIYRYMKSSRVVILESISIGDQAKYI